ncbi:unnamed protein product, partial [Durusdinium trenchii]
SWFWPAWPAARGARAVAAENCWRTASRWPVPVSPARVRSSCENSRWGEVLVLARLASRTRSEGSGRGKLLANCVQMASASESGASPEQLRELKALKAKCR